MRISRNIMQAMHSALGVDAKFNTLRQDAAEQHAVQTKRIAHGAKENQVAMAEIAGIISSASAVVSNLSKLQGSMNAPEDNEMGRPDNKGEDSKGDDYSGVDLATDASNKIADLANAFSAQAKTTSNNRNKLAAAAAASRKGLAQKSTNIAQVQAEALLQSYTEA